MKKILSLVLVLAMAFSAMLGVTSFAEDASGASAGALHISLANLEFADNVYLLIAVDYSAVGSADGISLKIKNNKTGEESTISAPAADIEAPTGCVAFKYDDIGAKNMGDELTIQAYLNGSASGDSVIYSILEYALRAESLGDAKLTALVKSMIKYGAEAQKAWSHEGTYDLSVEDYSLVKLKGGATFADGTTKAIMKAGDSLTAIKADAGDAWFNVAAHKLGAADTLAINYTEDNQTYFSAPESDLFGGSSNYYFNMNDYTGETVTYKYAKKSAAPDGEPYFNQTYAGIACEAIINNGYDITVTPGYIKLRGNVSLSAMGNTMWQNTVKEVAASDDKVFTLSLTVATDAAATGGAFAHWYLRHAYKASYDTLYTQSKDTYTTVSSSGKGSTHIIARDTYYYVQDGEGNYVLKTDPQYGRVVLLTNSAKSIINYYDDEGKKSASPHKIATPTATSTTEPGAFVTMHIVFDLENLTVTYYSGDSATPICTATLPVDVDYLCGSYLEHYAGASFNAYLKSVVVTKCDLTQYFK